MDTDTAEMLKIMCSAVAVHKGQRNVWRLDRHNVFMFLLIMSGPVNTFLCVRDCVNRTRRVSMAARIRGSPSLTICSFPFLLFLFLWSKHRASAQIQSWTRKRNKKRNRGTYVRFALSSTEWPTKYRNKEGRLMGHWLWMQRKRSFLFLSLPGQTQRPWPVWPGIRKRKRKVQIPGA